MLAYLKHIERSLKRDHDTETFDLEAVFRNLKGQDMSEPVRQSPAADPAVAVVDEYLRLVTIPDPVSARRCVAPLRRIRFTGAREFRDRLTTQREVWNDSAEWLLERAGLATL